MTKWMPEYEHQTIPTRNSNGTWFLQNVRDFSYTNNSIHNQLWVARTVNPAQVVAMYVYLDALPQFGILKNFFGHGYVSFTFSDKTSIACTIDARRKANQPYDPIIRGLIGAYDLIYVWGSTNDFSMRKTVYQKQKLTQYKILLPQETLKNMCGAFISETALNVASPKKYNSITTNCITEMYRCINSAAPKLLPWNISSLMTGLAARFLEKRNLIKRKDRIEFLPN